jgi:type I restriction enzyme R subunit
MPFVHRAHRRSGERRRSPSAHTHAGDAGEVLKAFKTYYETAELEATTDPHHVYDLRAKLDAAGHYDDFEVDRVAKVELNPKGTQAQLQAAIAPVADRLLKRYKAAQHDDKAAQAAKDTLNALVAVQERHGRIRASLRVPVADFRLRQYRYRKALPVLQALIPLLEFGRERDIVDLSKVMLTHHSLRNTGRQRLSLGHGETPKLPPMEAVGSGAVQEKEKAFLDEIIQKVNGLFDGELTDGDQIAYVNGVLKGKLLERAARSAGREQQQRAVRQFARPEGRAVARNHRRVRRAYRHEQAGARFGTCT